MAISAARSIEATAVASNVLTASVRSDAWVEISAVQNNDFELVTLTFASWNQIREWLKCLAAFRQVA